MIKKYLFISLFCLAFIGCQGDIPTDNENGDDGNESTTLIEETGGEFVMGADLDLI